MALSFSALFEWSLGEGHSHLKVPVDQRRNARVRSSIGVLVYAVVFAVAFISAPLSLAIAGAAAIYYVFAPLPRATAGADMEELESGPSRSSPAQAGDLSNVTDMAQATLRIQRHAAECHPTENLGA
jgi:hypothetical protein